MDALSIEEIFADDDLGILEIIPTAPAVTADDRLLTSFEEISEFVDENQHEPTLNISNGHEMMLYGRLKAIREDAAKVAALVARDRHSLLADKQILEKVDEVFDDDSLGLLSSDDEGLFQLKNIPAIDRANSDYVAKRTPCPNFDEYKPLFIQCQIDLKSGKKKLAPFRHQHQIEAGQFFVDQGLLVYISAESESKEVYGRKKSRIHCIFENGTQSDMYLRSLASELYHGGQIVLDQDANTDDLIVEGDEAFGYIYVLSSKSEDQKIKQFDNLYKIGFTSGEVEDRIKNAITDPTYLMAPVKIEATYECFNLNPQKFENLIHRFFGECKLSADVISKNGLPHQASEWFVAPLQMIDLAIQLIINGEIVHYRFDREKQDVVIKDEVFK